MTASLGAHLDPDLDAASRPREPGWRPLLGQHGTAQSHLRNKGVGPGDLFLFFGLFRRTRHRAGGGLRPVGDRFHALWGWLEVGDVLPSRQAPAWAAQHPHVAAAHLPRYDHPNDTLYMAAERSAWAPGTAGAGVLPVLRDDLVLTVPRRTSRHWALPLALHPDLAGAYLSHHRDPAAWTRDGTHGYLTTARRGQEFVITATDELRGWASGLLR